MEEAQSEMIITPHIGYSLQRGTSQQLRNSLLIENKTSLFFNIKKFRLESWLKDLRSRIQTKQKRLKDGIGVRVRVCRSILFPPIVVGAPVCV